MAGAGFFNILILAGKQKPTGSHVKRLPGARKTVVDDYIKYMEDDGSCLVCGFQLAREAACR